MEASLKSRVDAADNVSGVAVPEVWHRPCTPGSARTRFHPIGAAVW